MRQLLDVVARPGDFFFIAGTTAGGTDAERGVGLDGIFGESYN